MYVIHILLIFEQKRILDENLRWCEIDKLLTTKYIDWSYEREWRLILEYDIKIDKTENGRIYTPNNFDSIIEEIVLGTKCSQETEDLLINLFPNTKIERLKMHSDKFELYKE